MLEDPLTMPPNAGEVDLDDDEEFVGFAGDVLSLTSSFKENEEDEDDDLAVVDGDGDDDGGCWGDDFSGVLVELGSS